MLKKILLTLIALTGIAIALFTAYQHGYNKAITEAEPFAENGSFYIDFGSHGVHEYDGTVTADEQFFTDYERKHGNTNCTIYDASDLTEEMLTHRKGNTIVERVISVITDAKTGSYCLLNYDGGYYLDYSELEEMPKNGSIVVSYNVYNPDTNYIDNIIEQYDYVV